VFTRRTIKIENFRVENKPVLDAAAEPFLTTNLQAEENKATDTFWQSSASLPLH
jgi:hypothetical protein